MYALTCESPPQSVALNFLSVHDPCSPFLHGPSDLHQLLPQYTHGSYKLACVSNAVEPLNKGHLGTQAAVPYLEVAPYWEVRVKTVILCTFTASMM